MPCGEPVNRHPRPVADLIPGLVVAVRWYLRYGLRFVAGLRSANADPPTACTGRPCQC